MKMNLEDEACRCHIKLVVVLDHTLRHKQISYGSSLGSVTARITAEKCKQKIDSTGFTLLRIMHDIICLQSWKQKLKRRVPVEPIKKNVQQNFMHEW